MSLNLAHYLEMSAETFADSTAIIHDQVRLTYRELNAKAKRVANVLEKKGVRKGDKVAMMVPNLPYFPVIYYGVLYTGATVVPINTMLKGHEIQFYLEDSDATVFVAWEGFMPECVKAFEAVETCHHFITVNGLAQEDRVPLGECLEALVEEVGSDFDLVETMPDDAAVVLYTSGTTGHPKGAELTHFNMFFNAHCVRQTVALLGPGDVCLAVLPLFHSFGQTCVMNATLMAGAAISMVPKFDTEETMRVIERDGVTVLAAVPTMYFFMLNADANEAYDLSSVRMAVSGGSALPVSVFERFKEHYGIEILEGYGLTETSPVASFNISERPCKPGSIGLPLWGCEMRVMRDDGTLADTDEVGEIVVRGHNVMKGYYKKPRATEEVVVDGWLHTGDMGRVDDDGYFFIVDRKKDVIIRSGMNIYPREVEEVLMGHPAVLEAAVVGVPDEARGEEVKAFLSMRDGGTVTPDDLNEYCAERMARYKCPRYFEIRPELPKGPTGKVLKAQLRQSS